MRTMAKLVFPVVVCSFLAAGRLFAQTGGQAENTDAACQDGVDNDGDTFVDCKDQDCSFFVFCQQQQTAPAPTPTPPVITNENTVELCRNFRDDDNDGHIDCDDQDCAIFSFCLPSAQPAGAGAGMPSPSKGRHYTDPMTVEIEGDFDFDAALSDESLDDYDLKQYTLAFSPSVGLFVAKGLQLGLAPSVEFQKIEISDDDQYTVLGGVSLFLRYVIDLHSIVYPFAGVRMGALGGKTKPSFTSDATMDMTVLNMGPEVGIKIEVSHAIFSFFFRYLFYGTKPEDIDDWSHTHDIRLGVGFGLWI